MGYEHTLKSFEAQRVLFFMVSSFVGGFAPLNLHHPVIARYEAIANYTEADLPACDCFVPRNDVLLFLIQQLLIITQNMFLNRFGQSHQVRVITRLGNIFYLAVFHQNADVTVTRAVSVIAD
ncbi:hypothetical protein LX99_05078 [Mucilaginibacter oryzae]|uniref:Uncharacterized protein n=1 Tax=Mucilaginibacter oryzae TaxID=468058 RepID=A0A316GUA9_9SPHI|nr:hypothetical protein LX99_05078 [Mucilaginibacter oryzae]